MTRTNETEIQKYKWLSENSKNYGKTCHGDNIVPLIDQLKYSDSILDVGTGNGQQCLNYKKIFKNVYGVDWVNWSTSDITPAILKENNIVFFNCHANNIPLSDKSVEIVTSFDFLEHLIPEEVDKVLSEMTRIGKHIMIHSISHNPSVHKRRSLQNKFGDGELHATIQGTKWWLKKLQNYSSYVYKTRSKYLCIL